MPRNVILRDQGDGGVEVAAIDPRTPLQQVGISALEAIAVEVASWKKVLASI